MDTPTVFIVALAIGAAYLILNKHKVKKAITMKLGPKWQFLFSKYMPVGPELTAEGFKFTFPGPHGNVNDVQWIKDPPSLVGASLVAIKYRVTGGEFHPWEDPAAGPLVSLLIHRRGDKGLEGGDQYEPYRQYSTAAIPLEAGEFEQLFPLTHVDFGGVYGSQIPENFALAINEMASFGIAFGYNGGRAHGVNSLREDSTFELIALEIR